jgi:hypothetical protein
VTDDANAQLCELVFDATSANALVTENVWRGSPAIVVSSPEQPDGWLYITTPDGKLPLSGDPDQWRSVRVLRNHVDANERWWMRADPDTAEMPQYHAALHILRIVRAWCGDDTDLGDDDTVEVADLAEDTAKEFGRHAVVAGRIRKGVVDVTFAVSLEPGCATEADGTRNIGGVRTLLIPGVPVERLTLVRKGNTDRDWVDAFDDEVIVGALAALAR